MNLLTIIKETTQKQICNQPKKDCWLQMAIFFKPICFDRFLKCYHFNTVFLFFSAVVGEIDETIDSRLDLNSLRAEPIGPVVY